MKGNLEIMKILKQIVTLSSGIKRADFLPSKQRYAYDNPKIQILFYVGKTDEDVWKAIQILREMERRIGGSTGEMAAFKKSLKEIRCDIAVFHQGVHGNKQQRRCS
ncbi:hypothetical protein DICVIV_01547 [Dictyocaulus viviparus]|uniref:Uncharacterized protein n=1 Tax=Dictyocaulus viviparus TaxID=29172 RepID=A0A0D8Y8C7_DICVI|nr:hypothetical protein DICVIV_01547 [Dictyocaulus viviparus]